jgi:hypothetical protein
MARDAVPSFVKPQKTDPNQLKRITETLRQARDLRLEISSDAEQAKIKQGNLFTLERKTLPELFNSAGITNLGLEPEGNMPGYEAKREPYVHASIAASWPDEKRQAAFDYLTKHGGGDLIKMEISVMLPMKSTKQQKEVIAALKKLKVPYEVSRAVPWGSLTAFVREMITRKKQMPPLDVLGADVGEVVTMKPRTKK